MRPTLTSYLSHFTFPPSAFSDFSKSSTAFCALRPSSPLKSILVLHCGQLLDLPGTISSTLRVRALPHFGFGHFTSAFSLTENPSPAAVPVLRCLRRRLRPVLGLLLRAGTPQHPLNRLLH